MVSGFKAFTVYSWRQARLKEHLTAEDIVESFSIYSFKKYLMSTNYMSSTAVGTAIILVSMIGRNSCSHFKPNLIG